VFLESRKVRSGELVAWCQAGLLALYAQIARLEDIGIAVGQISIERPLPEPRPERLCFKIMDV